MTINELVDYCVAITEEHWYDEVPVPFLLRRARSSYADAVRAALAAGDLDDLPRNGAFVLSGLIYSALSMADIVDGLDITKQAASLLVDTLVLRGYLERATDPEDRRRMVVSLTERGRAAADLVGESVSALDAQLNARVSAEQIAGMRACLGALTEIRAAGRRHQEG